MRFLASFTFIVVFLLCACTSNSKPSFVDAEDIASNPALYDGAELTIRGYLVVNALNSPMFFLTKADADRQNEHATIDLFPANDDLHDRLKLQKVTCVMARGTFETYNHGKMVIGAFSKYGLLHIKDFTTC